MSTITAKIIRKVDGIIKEEYKNLSERELFSLKKDVYKFPPVKWSSIPSEIKHLVFYADLKDPAGKIYFATVYLDGAYRAFTEEEFREFSSRPRLFVFAVHRKE